MCEPPELVLSGLYGRDAAGRSPGRVFGIDLRLTSGLWVVVGTPADGSLAMMDLVTGRVRPRTGSVRFAGQDPWRSAGLRRRFATLGAEPDLPDERDAARAVELGARALGIAPPALEPYGLGGLARRSLASLSRAEGRSLELAIALAHPAPQVVALWEPFHDVVGIDRALVRQRLRDWAVRGAVVIVWTSCPDDAVGLTEQVGLLYRGRWLGPASGGRWGGGDLAVWVDPERHGGARSLAQALCNHPELDGVAWRGSAAAPQVVTVRAGDLGRAALVVAEECARLGVMVQGLHSQALDRTELVQQTLAMIQARANQAAADHARAIAPLSTESREPPQQNFGEPEIAAPPSAPQPPTPSSEGEASR